MSSSTDGLPMLPPWLSESDVDASGEASHFGYEDPVQNLPHEEFLDDRFGESSGGKKKRRGWRRGKSEQPNLEERVGDLLPGSSRPRQPSNPPPNQEIPPQQPGWQTPPPPAQKFPQQPAPAQQFPPEPPQPPAQSRPRPPESAVGRPPAPAPPATSPPQPTPTPEQVRFPQPGLDEATPPPPDTPSVTYAPSDLPPDPTVRHSLPDLPPPPTPEDLTAPPASELSLDASQTSPAESTRHAGSPDPDSPTDAASESPATVAQTPPSLPEPPPEPPHTAPIETADSPPPEPPAPAPAETPTPRSASSVPDSPDPGDSATAASERIPEKPSPPADPILEAPRPAPEPPQPRSPDPAAPDAPTTLSHPIAPASAADAPTAKAQPVAPPPQTPPPPPPARAPETPSQPARPPQTPPPADQTGWRPGPPAPQGGGPGLPHQAPTTGPGPLDPYYHPAPTNIGQPTWQTPTPPPQPPTAQPPYPQPPTHQPSPNAQWRPPPSLEDVPLRRVKRTPGTGWRKAVHHASRGLVNPGMSAEEMRLQELVARIRQPVRGDYRIGVLSLKGGVGKTTTTMGIGSTFASIRGDRVIAVDANPDFGTLSQRVPLQTRSTVRDLLTDQYIERYSDVRRHTSQSTSRLEVLASERDPAASEAFSEDEYRRVISILQRFYNVILTDCGTGLMHSAMAGTLALAHSLVLISSPAIDGARSAAATLDWLSLHGYDDKVRNAVVVINSPRAGTPNVGVQQLREYFLSRCRAVHIIPFDPHISEGAEIDLHRLQKATKRAYVELAATVADDFAVDHTRRW